MTYGSILQAFFNFLHSPHCFERKLNLDRKISLESSQKGPSENPVFQLSTVNMIIDRCLAHI